jgi:hypothetical protein
MQVVGVVEAGNWRQLCAVVRLEELGCTSLLPFTHLLPSQQAQVRSPSETIRKYPQSHVFFGLLCRP